MKNFIALVAKIQQELKAPKTQFNKFGKYKYRNCEGIMEGLKPVLGGLVVTVNDDVVMVGDRIYVKATAAITDGEHSLTNTAFARESLTKKGMDDSQITGTASSYARKYALNGLFLIDDTKDADSMDNAKSGSQQSAPNPVFETIRNALKNNDTAYVKNNWSGEISKVWGQLSEHQINSLNKMMGY